MMGTFTSPEVVERMIKVAFESLQVHRERLAELGIEHEFVGDRSATGSPGFTGIVLLAGHAIRPRRSKPIRPSVCGPSYTATPGCCI